MCPESVKCKCAGQGIRTVATVEENAPMKAVRSLYAAAAISMMWLGAALPATAQQSQPAAPAAAAGQSSQANAPALPTAQQVFDHYAEAIGGREAWEKITSRVSRGTVRIEGIEGTGSLLSYERAPNQELSSITLSNGAVLRDGFDGKLGWEQDVTGKVKELAGTRAADRKALSDFYSEIHLAKIYPHPKLVGQRTADGRLAYVVEANIPGGNPRLLYFDAESWLLFRTDVFENPLSPVPTSVERQDDYRDVDGIKYPYRASVEGPGVNIQYRFTVLHHNVDVKDDEIARPASSN